MFDNATDSSTENASYAQAVRKAFTEAIFKHVIRSIHARKGYTTLHKAESVLIFCKKIGEGMFPSEVTVEIRTADGQTVSFLADSSLLSNDPLRIKATRLGTESNDISVCLLPTENTDTGSRWVRIKDQDLQVA